MNKDLKKVIFILGISFLILFVVAKLFGVIQVAIVPTAGNEPTIRVNSCIIATNLIHSKKYEFVLFDQVNPKHPKGVYVQRLIGTEDDKIQIINGDVYVNDSIIDNGLNLSHAYIVGHDFFNDLLSKGKIIKSQDYYQIAEDKFVVHLARKDLHKGFQYERYFQMKPDSLIVSEFNNNWNADNFGPITVPKNKIFTLGDNRNASLDARYLGFIDVENVKGSILFLINNK